MADFTDLATGTNYIDIIDSLNQRIEALEQQLSVGSHTALAINAKRYNDNRKRWELWDGNSWVELASEYMINVNKLRNAYPKVNPDALTLPLRGVNGEILAGPPSQDEGVIRKLEHDALSSELGQHKSNTANPHNVTAAQVGLGKVNNVASYSTAQADNRFVNESDTTIAPDPSTVALRDANGRLAVAAAVNPNEAVRKDQALEVGDYGVGDPIQLTSADDLNNVVTPGVYYWDVNDSPANSPTNSASTLTVRRVGDNTQGKTVFLQTAANYITHYERPISVESSFYGSWLDLNIRHISLGVEQSWLDMSALRQGNTTYTNTTERSIIVSVEGAASFEVNGMVVRPDSDYGADVLVPPNATYRLNGGSQFWFELR